MTKPEDSEPLQEEIQKLVDAANAIANCGVRTHRHWSMLKQALREYEKAAHSKKVQAILRRDHKEFMSRAHPDWFEKRPAFETIHDQLKEKVKEARIEKTHANAQDGFWDGYILGIINARTLLTEFESQSANAASSSSEEETK